MMESPLDHERLSKWLTEIASTEEEEIDCDALDALLESVVATVDKGEDIRAILPAVAVHLDHCPECSGWYETLVELAGELD